MGKKNNVLNHYLSDKTRFADLFNALQYGGRQVIRAEDLVEVSATTYEDLENRGDGAPVRRERRGDLAMRCCSGGVYRLLLDENQENVVYNLPVRTLNYLAAGYQKQCERKWSEYLARGEEASFAESACHFRKGDRLMPIHLLWLYHGEEKWDGPRTLTEMLDLGEGTDRMNGVADITPQLVCVNELEGFERFRTELKLLLQAVHLRADKQGLKHLINEDEGYRHMGEETLEAVSVMLNQPSLWKKRKKYMTETDERKEYDMCTALKEWEAEIRNENEEQMKQMTVLLQEAEERAGQAEERAGQAEERAGQAEERVGQAEKRADQAEKRASQAEDRAEGYRAILLLHGIDPDESV